MPDELLHEIEGFRVMLDAAVRQTSLRATARAIPMSPTGLRGFLNGALPYVKTIEAMREWVIRTRPPGNIPPALLVNALLAVARDLPSERQPEATARLVATVEAIHLDAGLARPAWLAEVARQMERA